jgi:hypothetical protein
MFWGFIVPKHIKYYGSIFLFFSVTLLLFFTIWYSHWIYVELNLMICFSWLYIEFSQYQEKKIVNQLILKLVKYNLVYLK